MDQLLEMILIAIATVFATVIIGSALKRILQIRIFRYKCNLAFHTAILTTNIRQDAKDFWQKKYLSKRPSLFQLFFSRKEIEIVEWFTGEEIDAFFIPANQFNNLETA